MLNPCRILSLCTAGGMFGGGTGGRTAFVSRPLAGFTQQKVETLAVGGAGERLFVGTADGWVSLPCRVI